MKSLPAWLGPDAEELLCRLDAPDRALALYVRLLSLAPARFRRKNGREMLILFAERHRDARRANSSLPVFWAGALRDGLAVAFAERRTGGLFRGLGPDVHHALRALSARPPATLLMLLVLVLGMSASTTGWILLRDVLLRPLPYPASEELVAIWDRNVETGLERVGPTPANFVDWRAQTRTFNGMAAWYAGEPRTLMGAGDPVKVSVAEVTDDFFGAVGAQPQVGRLFGPPEVSADEAVAVLSHWLWVERFGANEGVVGTSIDLDGRSHRLAGVLPDDFALPQRDTGVWVPWNFDNSWVREGFIPRDYRYLHVVARLADGQRIEAAQEDLDALAGALAQEYPENRDWRPYLVPLRTDVVGDLRPALVVLYAAVSLVFVIALMNAVHLLLGRELTRQGEFATRAAIGASTGRLARQALLEAGMLVVAAALLSWGLAALFLRGFQRIAPATLPRLYEISLDAAALGYLSIAALLTTLALWAIALVVARGARRGAAVRMRGRTTTRWQSALIVGQVASTFSLTAIAVVLAQSLVTLLAVDPGYNPSNVLVARVFPDPVAYRTIESRLSYFDQLRERTAALPGVRSVGAGSGMPLNAYNNTPSVRFGRAEEALSESGPEAILTMATVGFLETLQLRLVAGRSITDEDTMDTESVIVVNEQLARTLWPGQEAVGRDLRVGFGLDRFITLRVVGVVAGARSSALKREPVPEAYRPHAQAPYVTMNLVVRADRVDAELDRAVRAVVLDLDATQPVHSTDTMADMVGNDVATDRLALWLVGVLTALSLVLAAAGIHGVMGHAVRARSHEIGVRKALGAQRLTIAWSILRRVAGRSVLGIALGTSVALFASGVLESFLYEVSATDPGLLLITGLFVVAVMVLASGFPARRAARIDAAQSLRADS